MELLGSSVLAADSGAGLAMQIASGLSERGVKKIIESRFYRTHAVSGDFVVELEVRDAAGKTQTLTFVEGK
jgi:hypothetical protein